MKLLAISGSLRRQSYNSSAIEALKILAANKVAVSSAAIDKLPLFNPDDENKNIPALKALKALKRSLKESSGLIISSPEYAHGISGPLKNALDWLVSGSEFPDMPIMLINTSPRARHAQDALKEVLKTMSGNVIEKAYTTIPLLGSSLSCMDIVKNTQISTMLMTGLDEFCVTIERLRDERDPK